ncbi:hypothetical protein B0E53_06766 [Micromonospora sp. MH33]|nr:hypothetical protein B0E53_06766 [Micromonospora sp. MH33]
MPTRPASPSREASTAASGACTASMPPPDGSACISRPRDATSRHASARDSTPATCAAVISPIECPPTRSGTIPKDSTSRNSATSTANRPAWVNSVWSSSSASAVPASANSTSRNGRDSSGSTCPHTSSSAVANTGNVADSSRPIPARWAPWPEKSTASWPRCSAAPLTGAAEDVPAANARSPARSSSRSAAATTARCSRAGRAVTDDHPTSTGRSVSFPASQPAQRDACPDRASAERADSSTGTGGRGASTTVAGSASVTGGCSRITCALVPEMPKDDTAARRGRSTAGHAVGAVASVTAPAVQSMCGDGSSTCSVGGTRPCRMASTILIRPATPAAAWVWPRFDLIDPSSSGRSAGRS